jgi:type IV pilus assembly protein PilN
MYSLDVNFLNDRPEYQSAGARGGGGARGGAVGRNAGAMAGAGAAGASKTPLYIGLGLLVAALAGSIGGWAWYSFDTNQLSGRKAELDQKLGDLEKKQAELTTARAQLKQANEEIQSLTGVFSNIKPWSAMSQDIRDRLPSGIQLSSITQIDPPPVAAAPTTAQVADKGAGAPPPPPPPPTGLVKIDGVATNFDQVNDFLVVLQKSNFLKPEMTRIQTAELQQPVALSPLSIPGANQGTANVSPKLPGRVNFAIVTALTEVPTSELLRELDRKGAVGLVSRIEALKEKGVIKP